MPTFFSNNINATRLVRAFAVWLYEINLLNAELNPIRHLLALLGAHHIVHVSRARVKCVTLGWRSIPSIRKLARHNVVT